MVKKSNPSTRIKKPTNSNTKEETPKISPWVEDYETVYSRGKVPMTEAGLERIAQELVEWSLTDEALTIVGFCRKRGLLRETLYAWKEKYPVIARAFKFAMEQLAEKREVGGLTRKFDPNFSFNTLPMYDATWREFMQWKANLKQDDGNNQKVVVEINDLSLRSKNVEEEC